MYLPAGSTPLALRSVLLFFRALFASTKKIVKITFNNTKREILQGDLKINALYNSREEAKQFVNPRIKFYKSTDLDRCESSNTPLLSFSLLSSLPRRKHLKVMFKNIKRQILLGEWEIKSIRDCKEAKKQKTLSPSIKYLFSTDLRMIQVHRIGITFLRLLYSGANS